jgi:hypothetical protein
MSIQFILNQLEDVYGKPSTAAHFANDTLFKSPFAATKAPKPRFYHMEQCQEIMTLGKLPYTPELGCPLLFVLLLRLDLDRHSNLRIMHNTAYY